MISYYIESFLSIFLVQNEEHYSLTIKFQNFCEIFGGRFGTGFPFWCHFDVTFPNFSKQFQSNLSYCIYIYIYIYIYAIYLSLYFSIKFKENTALIPLNSILNDALSFRVKTQTLKPRVSQEHLLIGVLWNTCFKNFVSFPGKGQCWRPYMYLPF